MKAAKCPKCGVAVPMAAGATEVTCPGCGAVLKVRPPASDRSAAKQPSAGPSRPGGPPPLASKTPPAASASMSRAGSEKARRRQPSTRSRGARGGRRAAIGIALAAAVSIAVVIGALSLSRSQTSVPGLAEMDREVEAIRAQAARDKRSDAEYRRKGAERKEELREAWKNERQLLSAIRDAERKLGKIRVRLTNAKAVFDVWEEGQKASGKEAQRREWEKHAGARKATYQGKTAKEWASQLKAEDFLVREHAAEVLENMGMAVATVVPELTDALKDRSARVRSCAARALANAGPQAKKAVPLLARAMYDREHGWPGKDAAEALGRLGPAAKDAVPELIKVVSTADSAYKDPKLARHMPYVKSAAIEALGKIGPEAKAAVPVLLKELRGRRQAAAMVALGKIKAPQAVPHLITALEDQDWEVRQAAAEALRHIGPAAKAAVPALVSELLDPENADRPDMLEILGEALANIGPGAKAALPVLIERMKERHFKGRGSCARALPAIERDGKLGMPALLEVLEERLWHDLYVDILDALGAYGRTAKRILPVLQASAEKGTDDKKAMAACLVRIGGENALVGWMKRLQGQHDAARERVNELRAQLDRLRQERRGS